MRYSLEAAVTELLHHLGHTTPGAHPAATDIAYAFWAVRDGLAFGDTMPVTQALAALRTMTRTINDEPGHSPSVYDWAAEVSLAARAMQESREAQMQGIRDNAGIG